MSEVINYSARLDELPFGTVIRNGEGGTTQHFVKVETGAWRHSDHTGKPILLAGSKITHTSSRMFLPAAVVSTTELIVQQVAAEVDSYLIRQGTLDGAEATHTAESIARRLSNLNLLADKDAAR